MPIQFLIQLGSSHIDKAFLSRISNYVPLGYGAGYNKLRNKLFKTLESKRIFRENLGKDVRKRSLDIRWWREEC